MGGRPSSNCTSTTAPITATTFPTAPGCDTAGVDALGLAWAAAAAEAGLLVETYRRLPTP